MARYLVAIVLGALIYTIGVFTSPRDDNFAVIVAPLVGCILSAVMVAVIIAPLRTVLRRLLPRASQAARLIVGAAVITAVVVTLSLALPADSLSSTRLEFFGLWFLFGLALVLPVFWPFQRPLRDQS